MRFTKMHGTGNDYVYVDLFDETVSDAEALARVVSDQPDAMTSRERFPRRRTCA